MARFREIFEEREKEKSPKKEKVEKVREVKIYDIRPPAEPARTRPSPLGEATKPPAKKVVPTPRPLDVVAGPLEAQRYYRTPPQPTQPSPLQRVQNIWPSEARFIPKPQPQKPISSVRGLVERDELVPPPPKPVLGTAQDRTTQTTGILGGPFKDEGHAPGTRPADPRTELAKELLKTGDRKAAVETYRKLVLEPATKEEADRRVQAALDALARTRHEQEGRVQQAIAEATAQPSRPKPPSGLDMWKQIQAAYSGAGGGLQGIRAAFNKWLEFQKTWGPVWQAGLQETSRRQQEGREVGRGLISAPYRPWEQEQRLYDYGSIQPTVPGTSPTPPWTGSATGTWKFDIDPQTGATVLRPATNNESGYTPDIPWLRGLPKQLVERFGKDIEYLSAEPGKGGYDQAYITSAFENIDRVYDAARQRILQEAHLRGLDPRSGVIQSRVDEIEKARAKDKADALRNLAMWKEAEARSRRAEARQLLASLEALERGRRGEARLIESALEQGERQRLMDLLGAIQGTIPSSTPAQIATQQEIAASQIAANAAAAAGQQWGSLGESLMYYLMLQNPNLIPQILGSQATAVAPASSYQIAPGGTVLGGAWYPIPGYGGGGAGRF